MLVTSAAWQGDSRLHRGECGRDESKGRPHACGKMSSLPRDSSTYRLKSAHRWTRPESSAQQSEAGQPMAERPSQIPLPCAVHVYASPKLAPPHIHKPSQTSAGHDSSYSHSPGCSGVREALPEAMSAQTSPWADRPSQLQPRSYDK